MIRKLDQIEPEERQAKRQKIEKKTSQTLENKQLQRSQRFLNLHDFLKGLQEKK